MSIKSDKWIRQMAEQHGMIEPFEPGQVRQVDGKKIISYGTSSYGYDIRCAREFKVFTNIHSTVVDPKNFDEKSFVDFEGDYCIIREAKKISINSARLKQINEARKKAKDSASAKKDDKKAAAAAKKK